MKTASVSLMSVAVLAALCALSSDAFARGFGGGGGNRGGEGGYRGGGGYHGGESGFHGGESGYHGGGGGYHGGESGYHGGESGYHPSGYGAGSHPGGYGAAAGYHPGEYGAAGYHPGANGAAGGGTPSSGQLGGFLGLPSSGGMQGGAAGAAGGGFSGQNLQNAAGTHPFSQTWAHSPGNTVQNWAQNHPQFGQDWNANHSLAWQPTGAGAAAWGAGAAGLWAGADGNAMGNWLGMDSPPADNYDYGNTINYQGGNVYYGSQPVASAGDYYQQASDLVTNSAAPADDSEWMPLGVFALVEGENQKPSSTVQLAVNKQGIIRGNSTNEYNNVLPLQGSVDKKTQRVAWTVGTDKKTVFDTGLYNLTKSEAPLLVHGGATKTDQLLMVRLKQQDQAGLSGSSQSSSD